MIKNIVICLLSVLVVISSISVVMSNDGEANVDEVDSIGIDVSIPVEDSSFGISVDSVEADVKSRVEDPALYDGYSWTLTVEEGVGRQLFLGKWKVVDVLPVEINVPSSYSGFDTNDNFRGQDLIDNIIGQEIVFKKDRVESQGMVYELAEAYKTYNLPLLSENTIIGCNSAKTLGLTDNYFSAVFFKVSGDIRDEGERDFASINQLYVYDLNKIYASVDGCFTFELERVSPLS